MPIETAARKKIHPISRACLQCREKHLKCDGKTPVCDRCASAGLDCTFIGSRRGRRPMLTSANAQIPSDAAQTSAAATPGIATSADTRSTPSSWTVPNPDLPAQPSPQTAVLNPEPCDARRGGQNADDERLIDLYYRYIHPAHPFLLPQSFYRRNRSTFPRHLRRAICFIASHHSSIPPQTYQDARDVMISDPANSDLFKVQSLILLALLSYARFERQEGNRALSMATTAAYAINLNADTTRQDHDPLFRESWRRTWWELYTISGLISLISGVNRRLPYPASMALPCESDAYDACSVSHVGNMEDMQARFRSDSSFAWPSAAYKVEAMRILCSVLDTNSFDSPSMDQATEASISSYLLSIPEGKRHGLKLDGEVDEAMSCALMIIHLAGICFHLPRSRLSSLGDYSTICGNDLGQTPSESPEIHSAAALRSAQAISRLLTTHSNPRTLSPCFSCALAFSSTVQLSEYSTQPSPRSPYLRESLQLQLSGLASLAQCWPVARIVRAQIAAFARDVMAQKRHSTMGTIQDLPDMMTLPALDDEQWLRDLMETETETDSLFPS